MNQLVDPKSSNKKGHHETKALRYFQAKAKFVQKPPFLPVGKADIQNYYRPQEGPRPI